MKKNIGSRDRAVRFILGLLILVAMFFVSGLQFKIILGVFGIFCVGEALISRCALYAILGKNTCPIE